MTFVIPMRIDPPNLTGIQQTERALDKVERAGIDAGKAVAKNMREGSVAADKAARAFKGVADAIKLEQNILQDIRGPAEKYELHLKAIARMHASGTITAKEYARSLREARHEFEKSKEEKTGGGIGSKAGAALGIVGSALAIGRTAIEAGDAATEQTNSLMRLTDTYHDLNKVRRDALSMSAALHADLAETADLFDNVRGGAVNLGYTYKEQIELTKALGSVVRLDNKGLSEAGALFERLEAAMASGTVTGSEVKKWMREFGQLGDIWTEKFGRSRSELVALVDKGQISIGQLVGAVKDAGPALEAELGKRPETWGVKWSQFKDSATASLAALGERNDTFTRAVRQQNNGVFGSVESLVTIFSDWEGAVEGARGWLNGYENSVIRVVNATNALAESHQDVIDKWERIDAQFRQGWVDQSNLQLASNQKVLDAALEGYKKREAAAQVWKQTEEYAMLQLIRGPMAAYERKLRALNNLRNKGRGGISEEEYVQGLGAIGNRSDFESGITQGGTLDADLKAYEDALKERAQIWSDIEEELLDKANANEQDRATLAIEKAREVAEKRVEHEKESAEKRKAMVEDYSQRIMGFADPFADGLIDAAHGADVAWSDMFSNLLANIEKAILKMLLMKAIEAGINAIIPGGGSLASATGATSAAADAASRAYPGGGSGDSSRSLSVTVQPAPVMLFDNPRALTRGISSRAGARAIADAERKHPNLRRSRG